VNTLFNIHDTTYTTYTGYIVQTLLVIIQLNNKTFPIKHLMHWSVFIWTVIHITCTIWMNILK